MLAAQSPFRSLALYESACVFARLSETRPNKISELARVIFSQTKLSMYEALSGVSALVDATERCTKKGVLRNVKIYADATLLMCILIVGWWCFLHTPFAQMSWATWVVVAIDSYVHGNLALAVLLASARYVRAHRHQ